MVRELGGDGACVCLCVKGVWHNSGGDHCIIPKKLWAAEEWHMMFDFGRRRERVVAAKSYDVL